MSPRFVGVTTNSHSQQSNCIDPASIIEAMHRFAKGPRRIGDVCGVAVYIDDTLPHGRIELRQPDGQVIGFSVDHPYIQGTKLEAAARRAMHPETGSST